MVGSLLLLGKVGHNDEVLSVKVHQKHASSFEEMCRAKKADSGKDETQGTRRFAYGAHRGW